MEILNAIQLKNGAKTKEDVKAFNSFTQPLQFIPLKEKDDDWKAHNLDWLEYQGLKQIRANAKRLMKNYNLAKGTIDKTDYLPSNNPVVPNEIDDLIEQLSEDMMTDINEDDAMELKFYPIIPNVINVLVSEFAKRDTKVQYRGMDEYTYNEVMDNKMREVEAVLLEDAYGKMVQKMIEMGMDPESEEAKQQLNPDALKQLPGIQEYYDKKYVTLGEQWAQKQHEADVHRFKIDELEVEGFRDMLITDREFWHFPMYEDDYGIELWNPVLTFYHKSPSIKYISEAQWAGKIDMYTVSDVIDMLGPLLTEDQMRSLESLHPVRAGRYLIPDLPNDGSYYNPLVSHGENLSPSLQMKRWMSTVDTAYDPNDIISWILGQTENHHTLTDDQMLRVTTAYWKTKRKVGYLTSIGPDKVVRTAIIDETYVIANNPVYFSNTSADRTAETLVFGDHIDWIWINQVWGGRKIGPNRTTFANFENQDEFSPIYVGIEGNKIGPLRYQFKGDNNLYGCKLPIEGRVFTERNTRSTGLVDLMKPAQIGYNMSCNQIQDILIDEIGPVIALDQNSLPQHSAGEDWGKHNFEKALVSMKDYSLLPLDTSLQNTENSLNFAHYQTLNLERTNQLMTRVQMANFFKQQALEVIGFTPQRLGQQIGQTDTARAIEQAVVGSYAQTEIYFMQHSDELMPRVHSMRTDIAQYYNSKRPSIRLQSLQSPDERAFLELNGTDLLLLDMNVFCKTNANQRAILEQMKQIAATNNTGGQTLFDIAGILDADSMGSLNNTLRGIERKMEEKAQAEHQREMERIQAESDARKQERAMEHDYDMRLQESKNRANILMAEIRASGFGATQDIDQNMQSDFVDVMDQIKESEQFQQTLNFDKSKENNRNVLENRKLNLLEKKIDTDKEIADNNLKIAKENQTKAELDAKKRKKGSEK